MRIDKFFIVGLVLIVSACSTVSYNRIEAPALFSALDSQPNGYSGRLVNGETFKIVDTQASKTLLCRTVQITNVFNADTERYCKIKGGEWR